jgi:hypothetical protein
MRISLLLVLVAIAAAVAIFFFLSPFFGAVIMIGALGGLMWTMVPASVERIARWLSVGR